MGMSCWHVPWSLSADAVLLVYSFPQSALTSYVFCSVFLQSWSTFLTEYTPLPLSLSFFSDLILWLLCLLFVTKEELCDSWISSSVHHLSQPFCAGCAYCRRMTTGFTVPIFFMFSFNFLAYLSVYSPVWLVFAVLHMSQARLWYYIPEPPSLCEPWWQAKGGVLIH